LFSKHFLKNKNFFLTPVERVIQLPQARWLRVKIVRLNLSDEEYERTYDKAMENGFGSVPEYVRFRVFNEKPESTVDFDELLEQFKRSVNLKNVGEEFRVRSCFDPSIWENIDSNDRRTLGRMIIHRVEKKRWLPIVPTRKDSGNAQWYKKI
jgi:hypothetical protein